MTLISTPYLNKITKYISKIKKAKHIIFIILSLITIPKLSNKTLHKTKRKLSNSQKKFVASSQKWRCNTCKNVLDHTYEIDHIKPLYKGGYNETNNLQALCRNCHGKKTFNDNLNVF